MVDVAVVVPARDRAGVLGRALASIERQTVAPREVIVVDDGSTDDSSAVAERAGVRVLRWEVPQGSGPARNRGVLAATSTWVAFLDSDDVWDPDHLATVLAAAAGRVLVTAAARDTDGGLRGNTTGSTVRLDPRRVLSAESIVVTSAVLARRSAVVAAGLFRDLTRAQDLDLWVRLLEQGPGVALTDVTATYQSSAGWDTAAARALNYAGVARLLADYADRPWSSRGLRHGALARLQWDDLRLAQADRRWADVGRRLGWLAGHPLGAPVLVRVALQRRRVRGAAGDGRDAGSTALAPATQ